MKKGKKYLPLKLFITMSLNTKVISNSNITILTLQIMAWAAFGWKYFLVHMWQLVEHAKSLSVTFIPMLFNYENIKRLGTCVIVRLPLIGSAPP